MAETDRFKPREHDSFIEGALMGAVAGAIGVWALDRVDWYFYDHESPETRRRTRSVRPGGMDPAHVMANRAAEALGMQLSPHQPHPAGMAVHFPAQGETCGPAGLKMTGICRVAERILERGQANNVSARASALPAKPLRLC